MMAQRHQLWLVPSHARRQLCLDGSNGPAQSCPCTLGSLRVMVQAYLMLQ
jgi:hypothetical protein